MTVQILRSAFIILAVAFASVLFGPANSAEAHDVLVDQFPSEGEVFADSPEEIRLTFNNRLLDPGENATVINVSDASGQLLVSDAPEVTDMDAVQALPELEDGAYQVVWRVVSSDGHPITGSLTFAVGEGGEDALANLHAGLADAEANEQAPGELAGASGLPTPMVFAVALAGVGILGAVLFVFIRKAKS